MCRLLAQWAILRSSELFFCRRLQTSSSLRERYGCVVLLPPGVPRACPTHPHSFSARPSGRPAAAPLPSERRRPVLFLSLSLSLAPEPTPPVSSCDIRSALGAEKQLQRSLGQGQPGTARDSQGQSGSLTVALLSPYCRLTVLQQGDIELRPSGDYLWARSACALSLSVQLPCRTDG